MHTLNNLIKIAKLARTPCRVRIRTGWASWSQPDAVCLYASVQTSWFQSPISICRVGRAHGETVQPWGLWGSYPIPTVVSQVRMVGHSIQVRSQRKDTPHPHRRLRGANHHSIYRHVWFGRLLRNNTHQRTTKYPFVNDAIGSGSHAGTRPLRRSSCSKIILTPKQGRSRTKQSKLQPPA